MFDEPDYQPGRADPPPPPLRESRTIAPWLLGGLLLAAAAAVWYFVATRSPAEPPSGAPRPVAAGAPASGDVDPAGMPPLCESSGSNQPAEPPPPLNDSDPLVRSAARSLSANPRIAAFLTTDNIVRRVAMAVDNVAHGATPAARFPRFRPAGGFQVVERNGDLFVDTRGFERYNPIADAFASIDPQAAADVCAALKPRLVEAYAELGRSEPFDVALERAIAALLRAPAAGADTRLVPDGATYAFEDERMESLTAAQKQLARMGPRNVRIIQDTLRQFALAIGIPAGRL